MMDNVLHLFGRGKEPDPEPEPEPQSDFDFEDEHFHLNGYVEELRDATGPTQVKELVEKIRAEVKDWPDG